MPYAAVCLSNFLFPFFFKFVSVTCHLSVFCLYCLARILLLFSFIVLFFFCLSLMLDFVFHDGNYAAVNVFLCLLVTYLAARHCTISSLRIFTWVCGSLSVLAYSTSGLINVK